MRIPLRWFIIRPRPRDGRRRWAVFLAAGLLAAAAARAADNGEFALIDRDHDGRKETRIWVKDGVPVKEEEDRDGDGRFERQTVYEDGKKRVATVDADGDGRADSWYHFEKGREVRSETDTNGDGTPDFWRYFAEGPETVLYEKDTNGDGKVDDRKMMVWAYDRTIKTHMYRPVWTESDRDFDGKIDDFWVKGSLRGKVRNKTGEPMKAAYKTSEGKKSAGGWASSAEVAENREDFERLMRENQADGKKE